MGLKNIITYQDIKNKIGCDRVFNHYFGKFSLGKAYNSVLRVDNKKSTGFYISKNGSIVYNDLSTNDKYNCVQFVAKLLNITYYKAIEHISNTFNLEEGSGDIVITKKIKERKKNKFIVNTKPFTTNDLNWWKQYGITKQELIKNNIYSLSSLKIGRLHLKVSSTELKFAYSFLDNENMYFKIYSPEDANIKWLSNIRLNYVYGLDKLSYNSDTLLITKSLKDYIVLNKFTDDVIALQNESRSAISDEDLDFIKSKYSNIFIFFDMDRAGVKAANHFYKNHGFIPIFVGSNKKNVWQNLDNAKKTKVKDPSDFSKIYGLKNLELFLKTYNII